MKIQRTIWDSKTPDEKQKWLVDNRSFLQKYETIDGVEFVLFTRHSDDAIILPIPQRNNIGANYERNQSRR